MIGLLREAYEWLKNRFVLFALFVALFIVLNLSFRGTLLPVVGTDNLWFYSGIVMVLFSLLFIEPYYTSPKNVITNSVPLLLVLIAIRGEFQDPVIWWVGSGLLGLLLVLSVAALALEDKNRSSDHRLNRISESLKNFVVLIGQGKILYSAVFIYFLVSYHSIQDYYTVTLFVLWSFILLINPKRIKSTFATKKERFNENAIGEIFSVQAKKIFLVKLFEDRKGIAKFNIVRFRYSMQDFDDWVVTGIVFDTYLLNQEKWSKVLQLRMQKEQNSQLDKNVVFKITDEDEKKAMATELNINNFVGVVIEGSHIGKIRFEYSQKEDDLQEGDLLELRIGKRRLFYQVVSGTTAKEILEHRNETGFITGEAIQLGEWEASTLSFQKYGWVPYINTPLFKADTSDISIQEYKYPEYRLGVIPNTTLPSILNLKDAVSHHMALLGVTGSGKSFIARELIKELVTDTRVICVDFTGEWVRELKECKMEQVTLNKDNINEFLDGKDRKVGIVELPSISNTSDVLKTTEKLFEILFDYAKKSYEAGTPAKITLVLEEAHTITPETTFLGDLGDYGSNKALVNKMGQVALQGRKYGVGMLVIAQRTANVSKTVLTQCNTIVCFQAFDETSFNFLGNYIGRDLVQTLPNLKQYHAIVTGKGVRSNIPMIINLERKAEKEDTSTK